MTGKIGWRPIRLVLFDEWLCQSLKFEFTVVIYGVLSQQEIIQNGTSMFLINDSFQVSTVS